MEQPLDSGSGVPRRYALSVLRGEAPYMCWVLQKGHRAWPCPSQAGLHEGCSVRTVCGLQIWWADRLRAGISWVPVSGLPGRNTQTIGFRADGHGSSDLSVTPFQILFEMTKGISKRTPENVQETRRGAIHTARVLRDQRRGNKL